MRPRAPVVGEDAQGQEVGRFLCEDDIAVAQRACRSVQRLRGAAGDEQAFGVDRLAVPRPGNRQRLPEIAVALLGAVVEQIRAALRQPVFRAGA